MKIIASINSDTFLMQAGKTEIARIMGFRGLFDMKDSGRQIEVGKDIQVNALWNALQVERERPGELSSMAKQLRAVADKVDAINAAVANPIIESPKE